MVAAVSDRRSQAAVLFLVGAMALYLGRSDAALAYVKAGLQPLLLASGAILMGLGVAAALWYRREQDGQQPHGPRWPGYWPSRRWPWSSSPRPPWRLRGQPAPHPAAPHQPDQPNRPGGGRSRPGPVPPADPPGDGAAVPLTLAEYMVRDYEAPHTLAGVRIRLVGFVSPTRGQQLPADPLRHHLLRGRRHRPQGHHPRRPGPPCPRTWLEVEGRWQQRSRDDPDQPVSETPLLLAESIR